MTAWRNARSGTQPSATRPEWAQRIQQTILDANPDVILLIDHIQRLPSIMNSPLFPPNFTATFASVLTAIFLSILQIQADSVRLPIDRDTWVSGFHSEVNGNNGGSSRLKTKGIQELSLLDFPAESLKGKRIEKATLFIRTASNDPQLRVTASTVAADWNEGTANGYAVQTGSASFNWARQDEQPWAEPGADITSAIAEAGHTIWCFADASAPDEEGWQSIEIGPDVIHACIAGLSYGFALIDDVGSEYTRDGSQFQYKLFPNRFFYSREAGRQNAPYLVVETGPEDLAPPQAVSGFKAKIDRITMARQHCAPSQQSSGMLPLRPGMIRLDWIHPGDNGPAGTAGYHLRYSVDPSAAWNTATPVPRYLVPMAGQPGAAVSTILPDLGWGPDADVTFLIRPIDGAGNMGPIRTLDARTAGELQPPVLPEAMPGSHPSGQEPLKCGDLEIGVIDPLDKISARGATILPAQSAGYLQENHLYSADERRIRLYSARNEFTGFQIVLEGAADQLTLELEWAESAAAPSSEFFFARPVSTPNGPFPDPLVPFPIGSPIPPEGRAEGQSTTSVFAEIYVPHELPPGLHRGVLNIASDKGRARIDIQLHIWDFTLPDFLSFVPEMNCYGLPPNEMDFYRMAHLHRTSLNRLPYGWRGRNIDRGCAPAWDGRQFDWSGYDQRFGPILDGSAFADLPRANVPVDTFYLPINEDWPLDVEEGFTSGYWADSAFTMEYRTQWVSAVEAFARHIQEKEWNHPVFEFYLNNKVYHKDSDWWRSSATWIFDEPVNTQDFWALRWFGKAFHEGVRAAGATANPAFRCDISRPEWQRDILDGILNVNVCGAFYQYHQRVLEKKHMNGQMVFVYGTTNPVDQPNTQPAAWCVDSWARGLDGVLPWQTIGNDESWIRGDPLSLFYPGAPLGQTAPVASIRLKAYRRGQQDTEYFTLLQQSLDLPRWVIGDLILQELGLVPQFSQGSPEDAGGIGFEDLSPFDLWRLRVRTGQMLSQIAPPYQRRLVDLKPCFR
jgi:hypothetical protein